MPRAASPLVLACDVGGTKTSLALFELSGATLACRRVESYRSREHASLDGLVERFRAGAGGGALLAAGFGVAGPVSGNRARITNLPWEIDGASLARALGLGAVALLNDVEAHAWALERLGPGQVAMLQEGLRGPGCTAVVAAGTGVGYAALLRGGGAPVSLPSEGGHADFAPASELQAELWKDLRARHGHVSVERVLSGPGILAIHEFLCRRRGLAVPDLVGGAIAEGRGPAEVSRAAIEGGDPICREALDLFLAVYGAEAGSWMLRTLATGGLYLGGGIAARVLLPPAAPPGWQAHAASVFLEAFRDKGRFRALLESVPVGVILDDRAALLGAAHRALALATAAG